MSVLVFGCALSSLFIWKQVISSIAVPGIGDRTQCQKNLLRFTYAIIFNTQPQLVRQINERQIIMNFKSYNLMLHYSKRSL